MSTPVGPFDVTGPAKRISWCRSALISVDADVDLAELLPKRVPVTFGDTANIPGTNRPAIGITNPGPTIDIRHGMANAPNLSKATTEYTLLHEGLGHARMKRSERPFTKDQWQRILALLKGVAVPGAGYWNNKVEAVVDSMVEALSAIESPYKHDPGRPNAPLHYSFYIDEADYPTLKAIWLEPKPIVPPTEPEPPVDPLPEPPNPCQPVIDENAALKARVMELSAELLTVAIGEPE